MFSLKISIFILFIGFITAWENNEELLVQINDGKILGRYMTSKTGLPVRAFFGIPFAKPPVGNLRFKSPQKAQAWEGVKNCQKESPVCTQMNIFGRFFDVVTGEEDCLYLNVYSPGKTFSNPKKLPVIYWIHGGGWMRGEASNFMYGHEHILDHDVILVTGNYRVGPIGFLSTEDANAPGNLGFKDQNFILRWIQENIEHFGGDKNSVTIWGDSAGGASVHYQMISPLSEGLFHRAISHSGALMECWSDPARPNAARNRAMQLAQEVNCTTSSTSSMVDCLREVSAFNLTLAVAKLFYWDYDPAVLFMPVVEDFPTDEEKFLPSRNYLGKSSEIPWLVGINSEENLLKLAAIFENQVLYNDLMSKSSEVFPHTFYYYDIDENQQTEVTKAINKFYFGSEELNALNVPAQSLINLFSDAWFIGFIEALQYRFSSSPQATYVYLFSHKGTASFSATSTFYGTSHVDDLMPFFPMHRNIFISSKPTDEDQELTTILPQMWINFATTGNPNTQDDVKNIPLWPQATSIPFDYMQIGNENGNSEKLFKVKNGLYEDRANFWMELRKNYLLNRWMINVNITSNV